MISATTGSMDNMGIGTDPFRSQQTPIGTSSQFSQASNLRCAVERYPISTQTVSSVYNSQGNGTSTTQLRERTALEQIEAIFDGIAESIVYSQPLTIPVRTASSRELAVLDETGTGLVRGVQYPGASAKEVWRFSRDYLVAVQQVAG